MVSIFDMRRRDLHCVCIEDDYNLLLRAAYIAGHCLGSARPYKDDYIGTGFLLL
jgi:hypothetical protein